MGSKILNKPQGVSFTVAEDLENLVLNNKDIDKSKVLLVGIFKNIMIYNLLYFILLTMYQC